jgi:predicted outer membrane repeat protein
VRNIQLLNGQLTITSALTIDGTGVTLTAADNTRILTIDASGEDEDIVAISGLTFADGHITKNGGYGGAIYQINGNVTLTDVTFENNYARMGGAYFQKAGTSAFENVIFENNTTNYYGGAFYCYSGTARFTETNFENNSAKWGGAIYLTNTGNITLTDAKFNGNEADWGGAVHQSNGTLTATGVSLTNNYAEWGGGFYIIGGTTDLNVSKYEAPATTTRFGAALNATPKAKIRINGQDIALLEYLDLDNFDDFI